MEEKKGCFTFNFRVKTIYLYETLLLFLTTKRFLEAIKAEEKRLEKEKRNTEL